MPKEEDVDRWLVAVAASGDVDALSRKGAYLPHAEASDQKESLADLHAVYVEKRLNVYLKEVNKILAELPTSALERSTAFRNYIKCAPKDHLTQKNVGGPARSFFLGSPRPAVPDATALELIKQDPNQWPPRSAACSTLASSSRGFTEGSKDLAQASNSRGFTEASSSKGFTDASNSKGFDRKSQSAPDLSATEDSAKSYLSSLQASHYGFFATEVSPHLVGEFCGEDHAVRLLAKARRMQSSRMCLPMMSTAADLKGWNASKQHRGSVETTTVGQTLQKLEQMGSKVTQIPRASTSDPQAIGVRMGARDSFSVALKRRSTSSILLKDATRASQGGESASMSAKLSKTLRKQSRVSEKDGDARTPRKEVEETDSTSPNSFQKFKEALPTSPLFVDVSEETSSVKPRAQTKDSLEMPDAGGLSPNKRMQDLVKNKLGLKLAAPQLGMGSLAVYALGTVKDERVTRELCDGLRAIILGADGLGGTGAIRCSPQTMHADLAFGSQAETMELYKKYRALIKMDRERGTQELTADGNDLPVSEDDDGDDAPVPEDCNDDPSLMNLPPIRWSTFKSWVSHERTFNDDLRVRSLCGSLLRALKQWKTDIRGKMPAVQFGIPLSRMMQWMWPGANSDSLASMLAWTWRSELEKLRQPSPTVIRPSDLQGLQDLFEVLDWRGRGEIGPEDIAGANNNIQSVIDVSTVKAVCGDGALTQPRFVEFMCEDGYRASEDSCFAFRDGAKLVRVNIKEAGFKGWLFSEVPRQERWRRRLSETLGKEVAHFRALAQMERDTRTLGCFKRHHDEGGRRMGLKLGKSLN
eukprot:gnl/MRDRNA2_/MRDRNA2_141406_c0_seq1.p1 gnl/MRDRNA2_/MRDRNA2_141406_c0~~gnl/MRDRNA2_/MRDRNA2_141406_c0_seq1.p1  ORF type:complete len:933 (-),score=193.07 gnl/MRDRNA2_/MRDRNA2_141406_c0_seq1:19-2454(-)